MLKHEKPYCGPDLTNQRILVVFYSLLPDEMAVAELVPEIAMLDRFGVRPFHSFDASDGAEHSKMACNRVM